MKKACCALILLGSVIIGSLALAQEETTATRSVGGFSIYSKPSGALVYMEGEYDFIGHTPTELPFTMAGTYRVKAFKRGYESWSTKMTLVGDERNSLYIKLVPKTRLKTALRSAIFPGWGQFYTDQKTKGAVIGFLEAGSLVAAVFAHQSYDEVNDDYQQSIRNYRQAKNVEDIPRLREEMEKRADDADEAYALRTVCIGLAAAVWAYNVVESVIFFPRYEESIYEGTAPLITGEIYRGETRLLLTKRF
jgi:hypothetical protein